MYEHGKRSSHNVEVKNHRIQNHIYSNMHKNTSTKSLKGIHKSENN